MAYTVKYKHQNYDKMKTKILMLVLSSAMLTSCATIFSGSKSRVTLYSNIEKADKLSIDGLHYSNITFPYVTKVKRGFTPTLVRAEQEGYTPLVLEIDKSFNPVAILNLTDILGWGIDAATGAMMKPEYKGYDLNFEKKE